MPYGKWGEGMIIEYDTRPNATIDEKIRSLIDSIMLAFNEAGFSTDTKVLTESESKDADISTLAAQIRQLSGDVASLGDRLDTAEDDIDTLEARWTAPDAPTEDGAYKLTVTVTDGVPVYTWEAAE